jgi:type IX secretion system PorP/SprF family membrane protein
MRKILIIIAGLFPAIVFGQQFPSLEGFNLNPFNLSPAYAGIRNSNTLFIDYRSDWSGVDGGPTTCELSYNQKLAEKKPLGGDFNYGQSDLFVNPVGMGARFIYDKADIFKQILFLGTYTYEVRLAKGHFLNLGLSAGFYRNSIDLGQYYNNPGYVQDLALIDGQLTSKIKFATDVSALYRYEQFEAGILFSNVIFGTIRYQIAATSYKPMKNYLVHTSYLFKLDDKWSFMPVIIARGGENIPVQIEVAPAFNWNNRIWMSGIYRTGGIFGAEAGCQVVNGIFLNYSYSLSTNIALNVFGSHQVTLGIKIPESKKIASLRSQ